MRKDTSQPFLFRRSAAPIVAALPRTTWAGRRALKPSYWASGAGRFEQGPVLST